MLLAALAKHGNLGMPVAEERACGRFLAHELGELRA